MSSGDLQVRSAPKWMVDARLPAPKWMPVGAWRREEYVTPTWSEMGETLMHDGGPGLSEWAFSMDLEHETVAVANSASTPHFVDGPRASPTTCSKHLEWGRKISPNDVTVVASATPHTAALAPHKPLAVARGAHDTSPRSRRGTHGHGTPPDESGTRQATRVAGAAKSFQECMEG